MSLSRRKEKLVGRLRNRRMRAREGRFLVEGLHTSAEAVAARIEIDFAVATTGLRRSEAGAELVERLESEGIPVEWVDEDTLADLSDTETPSGPLLVCREPEHGLGQILDAAGGGGRYLVLDAVQDPGNLGTLIRAGRAFGLDGALALDGTVDPWNPKAVRAAAGTSFRIPVVKAGWEEVEPALAERDVGLLVAESGGADVAEVAPERPWALVVGNEGSGPRSGVLGAARERVAVPMPGGAESLNVGVAGAILLYVLSRAGATRG